jgi:hypothetical protein
MQYCESTRSKACSISAGGNSRKLVGSKQPARAHASIASSTSDAMMERETDGDMLATSRSHSILNV